MSRWLRQIPNFISAVRILLVVPITLTLLHQQFATTLALFVVAAVSDAADGFLARHFGWQTFIGGILDPIADKLMLATVFVILSVLKLVPVWLTAAVLARDLVIVLGAIAYRLLLGPIEAQPSLVSKISTLCQMAFIVLVIARELLPEPSAWAVLLLGAITFVTVVISGIDYVLRYSRLALDQANSRRSLWQTGDSKLT